MVDIKDISIYRQGFVDGFEAARKLLTVKKELPKELEDELRDLFKDES